jgi:hypothetical protein
MISEMDRCAVLEELLKSVLTPKTAGNMQRGQTHLQRVRARGECLDLALDVDVNTSLQQCPNE